MIRKTTYNDIEYRGSEVNLSASRWNEPMQNFHVHNVPEIVLVTSPDVKITFMVSSNAEPVVCEAPCLIYYHEYDAHLQINEPADKYRHYCFKYRLRALYDIFHDDSVISGLIEANSFIMKLEPNELAALEGYARLYQHYFTNQRIRTRDITLEEKLILALLLIEVNDLINAKESFSHAPSQEIQTIIRYIKQNYMNDISIDTITSEFYISRAKLTKEFKKYTNITVNDYINMQKLYHACELLLSGDRVAEIADKLGYSSAGYFSRVFYKYFNITPKKYFELYRD